jgi:hypothetical protein
MYVDHVCARTTGLYVWYRRRVRVRTLAMYTAIKTRIIRQKAVHSAELGGGFREFAVCVEGATNATMVVQRPSSSFVGAVDDVPTTWRQFLVNDNCTFASLLSYQVTATSRHHIIQHPHPDTHSQTQSPELITAVAPATSRSSTSGLTERLRDKTRWLTTPRQAATVGSGPWSPSPTQHVDAQQ